MASGHRIYFNPGVDESAKSRDDTFSFSRVQLSSNVVDGSIGIRTESFDEKGALVSEGVVETLLPDTHLRHQLRHARSGIAVLPEDLHGFLQRFCRVKLFLRTGTHIRRVANLDRSVNIFSQKRRVVRAYPPFRYIVNETA